MHFSTLVTLTLSVFSARAIGDDCVPGFLYCGGDLLTIGNYQDSIVQASTTAKIATDVMAVHSTLFLCVENGLLASPNYCTQGCKLAGADSQKNDTCKYQDFVYTDPYSQVKV